VPSRNVADVVRSARFSFGDEDQLQAGIADALINAGYAVAREVRLNARDRIDLLVHGGIGIEVKIAGPASAVRRQLARYAEHESIQELILVTRSAASRASTSSSPPTSRSRPAGCCSPTISGSARR
jgi:hypothetical protein